MPASAGVHVSKVIHALSLAYVSAPVAIFAAGYLRLPFAIPLMAILLWSLVRQLARETDAPAANSDPRSSRAFAIALAVLVTAFAVMAGFGGFVLQDGDYGKHNAVFKDLMEMRWPLAYQETGADARPRILNTYVGYYLPAAVVGKLLGVKAGFLFSLAWAALGLYLAIHWFLALLRKRSLWLAALFLLFGGIDLLGYVLLSGKWPSHPTNNFSNWMMPYASAIGGVFWVFPSNPGVLANGPHHVLPCWVALLMMMHDGISRKSAGRVLFLWATTTYASAFFAIGMAPFVAICLLGRKLRELATFENTVAFAMLTAVSTLYILSNDGRFTRGFIWDYVKPFRVMTYLLLYYVTSVGLYLVCWPEVRDAATRTEWKPWLYASVGCVLLFPLYRIGPALEFPIKALLPSVVVFLACFANALTQAWREGGWRQARAATALAAVGAYSGIALIAWAASWGFRADFYRTGVDDVQRLDELARTEEGRQLFSGGDSFFWKHIAARPEYFRHGEPFTLETFLSESPATMLDERFPKGALPYQGYGTRKNVRTDVPQLTFEVLLRPKTRQTKEWAVIATNEAPRAGFAMQQYETRNNHFYIGLAGRKGDLVSTPVALLPGRINYLVFSYSEGRLTTYLNGTSMQVDASPGFEPVTSSIPVWLGNMSGGLRPFNGRIYQFRVSARAMDDEQVRSEWSRFAAAVPQVDR